MSFTIAAHAAAQAYGYPLLIKQLLHTTLTQASQQEIVYADRFRYTYADFYQRVQRLAQVDGAFTRQAGAQHGRNEASREHAVGDAALEHRVFGILGVQMHRVVVARHGGKQQNVRFRHGFGVFGALTNGEIFEVNSRHD